MNKLFLLLLATLINLLAFGQTDSIRNQSVVDMIDLGFSEEVILTKIKTSDCLFDTSIEALKVLKDKGISDSIIVAIMNYETIIAQEPGTDSTFMEEKRIGIYVHDKSGVKKILPTVFSGSKTNTLGSALSYGLASSSIKSVLNNAQSVNTVNVNAPEFLFFFVSQENQSSFGLGLNNWWFFSATSPSQFMLVKLESRGRKREVKIGSVNIYSGVDIGVDEESVISFDILPINDYTFKVVPKDPLVNGEYCFIYQGSSTFGGYTNQSVFDFSIQAEKVNTKFNVGDTVWVLLEGKPKRCDVAEIELKKDGVYYTLYPHFSSKTLKLLESECYSSKQDLIDLLRSDTIKKDNAEKSK